MKRTIVYTSILFIFFLFIGLVLFVPSIFNLYSNTIGPLTNFIKIEFLDNSIGVVERKRLILSFIFSCSPIVLAMIPLIFKDRADDSEFEQALNAIAFIVFIAIAIVIDIFYFKNYLNPLLSSLPKSDSHANQLLGIPMPFLYKIINFFTDFGNIYVIYATPILSQIFVILAFIFLLHVLEFNAVINIGIFVVSIILTIGLPYLYIFLMQMLSALGLMIIVFLMFYLTLGVAANVCEKLEPKDKVIVLDNKDVLLEKHDYTGSTTLKNQYGEDYIERDGKYVKKKDIERIQDEIDRERYKRNL